MTTSASAALRIRNSRRLLGCGLGLIAAFGVWASVGRLEVISTATGEMMPVSHVKAVQHLEGGIVSAILVQEGDRVEKGQALLQLDPIKADSDVDELKARLRGLAVDIARLTAEAAGQAVPDFPGDVVKSAPDEVAAARKMFDTKRSHLAHDIGTQQSLIAQRRQELSEVSIRMRNTRKSLDLVSDQVRISDKLLMNELTSRMLHLDIVRQQQTLRSQFEADQAAIPRVEAALKEANERLSGIRENFTEIARKELALARQSHDELSQRAMRYANARERTMLRAPVEGIIKTIAIATEGGVIQPGQTVMEIVPVEDKLVIEAKLPVQDIGYVHRGQSVRVTLNSADASLLGYIDGKVETVSPDATVTNDGHAFYKIRIVTERNHFEASGYSYQLYPGVQVACGIHIGSRTVAQYLLSPWFRSLRFAFEER